MGTKSLFHLPTYANVAALAPASPTLCWRKSTYVGNRADGARPLDANFWGLEFFDYPVTDAVLLALAGRAQPA